jgi:hypothetical protein
MDAIKKKMVAMKMEKENALDRTRKIPKTLSWGCAALLRWIIILINIVFFLFIVD